ncbi:MAG TPA: sigma-70 family RNA polymerase sigma factor [Gemmatimonadaceae bacterium]|nr:sigma-70 family RNA polymerase sigma factor [Gemmatimonadaceae bacterium]
MDPRESVTDLLVLAAAGDRAALDRAFPLVYDELRRLAHHQLRRENEGHTLSTTALVHEAYMRLVDQKAGAWQDRRHFFAIAATAMRRILVDHARRHHADKRGAARKPVPLENIDQVAVEDRAELLVMLDDALERLATMDERQARVVECRFFGGYTEEETAETLGIGLRTAKRDWARARSWLFQELYPDSVAPGTTS